jgi:hypothetical protein
MSGYEILGWFLGIYIWLFANPIIALALYLLPIIIAFIRLHRNLPIIMIISLLFGWIFLLWLILVIWAAFGGQDDIRRQQ